MKDGAGFWERRPINLLTSLEQSVRHCLLPNSGLISSLKHNPRAQMAVVEEIRNDSPNPILGRFRVYSNSLILFWVYVGEIKISHFIADWPGASKLSASTRLFSLAGRFE